ncbi:MAG: flagellar FliJ family protein [Planctomycetota bacterium]
MTKPYRFRYEPILLKARADERSRQRDLALLLRQRIEMHDKLRGQQQTLAGSKRDLAGALIGKVDLSAVGDVARYGAGVEADGHSVVRQLALVEQQVVVARERLLEATRKRRSLERLEEQGRDTWRRDVRRADQKECDEAAQIVLASGEFTGKVAA